MWGREVFFLLKKFVGYINLVNFCYSDSYRPFISHTHDDGEGTIVVLYQEI